MTTTRTQPTSPTLPPDTKERLIDAGMEVFAERGFADASIREICRRATANPAAVNYHFGDKERFYAEVLVTCHQQAVQRRQMPRLSDDPEHPEKVLGTWIRWFLEMLLGDAGSGPLGKLMAREMFAPTAAFDALIQRSMLPMMMALRELVDAILGDGPDPDSAYRAMHSVLGQCLLYKHAKPAFDRMQALVDAEVFPGPGPQSLTRDLDALAHHITDFSLAGLSQLRDGGDRGEDP